MPFIIIVGVLCVFSFAAATLTKKGFYFGLILTVFALCIIGSVAGIFGILPFAVYFFQALLVASFIYCIFSFFVSKKLKLSDIGLDVFIFVGLSGVLWYLCRGRMFVSWDAFSHWGIAVKYLYIENTLYTDPSYIGIFPSYLPGYTIFQYMLSKISLLDFREDVMIYIGALLTMTFAVFPITYFGFKKQPILGIVTGVLLFLAPTTAFDHNYYYLGVDMLLGSITAFMLYVLFFEKHSSFKIVLLTLGGILLTLTKNSGIALGFICFAIIWGYVLFVDKPKKKIYYIIPVLAAVLTDLSWRLHLAVANVPQRWEVSTGTEHHAQVVDKFVQTFFDTVNYGDVVMFPPFVWVLIAFILISYLTVFSSGEAVVLASFYRYVATGIYPLVCVLTISVMLFIKDNIKSVKCYVVSAGFVLFVFANSLLLQKFTGILFNAPIEAAQTHHERYFTEYTVENIMALGVENPRLYLVTPNDGGELQMRVRYTLYPQTLPEHESSIAINPDTSDLSVQDVSLSEWETMLAENFDYVYIFQPETMFVESYKTLFEDEAEVVLDRMFEVVRQDDGGMILRRIYHM